MATISTSEDGKWYALDPGGLLYIKRRWLQPWIKVMAIAILYCPSDLTAQPSPKPKSALASFSPFSLGQYDRVLAEGKYAMRYAMQVSKSSTGDTIAIPAKAIELLSLVIADGPRIRIDGLEQLLRRSYEGNDVTQMPRSIGSGGMLAEDPSSMFALYVSGRLWANGVRGRFLGNYHLNSHCENHDAQTIMAGLGMLNNGRIHLTTEQAWRLSHMVAYGSGAYGAVFSSGLVAASRTSKTMADAARKATNLIPKQAHYRQVLEDVMRWHQEQPTDYAYCLQKLNAKWAPTAINPITIAKPQINPDAKLNGGIILMALLYANSATKVPGVAEGDIPYYIIGKAGHAILANAWVAGLALGTKQLGIKATDGTINLSTSITTESFRNYQTKLPTIDAPASGPLILEQIPSYRGMQEGALAIQISPQSCIVQGAKLSVKAVSYPAPKQVQWHWGDHTYSDGDLKTTEGIHTYNQAGLYEINCYALLENGTTLQQLTTIRVDGPKASPQPCLPRGSVALSPLTKSNPKDGKSTNWSAPAKAIWFETNRNTTLPMVASILSPITNYKWAPSSGTGDGYQLSLAGDSIKDKESPILSDNYGLSVVWGSPNGQAGRPDQGSYISQSTVWKMPLLIPKIKQLSPEAMIDLGNKVSLRTVRKTKFASDQLDAYLAYTTKGLVLLLPNDIQDLNLQFDARLDGQVTFDNTDTRLNIQGLGSPNSKININDREMPNAGITISPVTGTGKLLMTIDWNTLRLNLGLAQREEQGGINGVRQFGFQLSVTKATGGDQFGLFYSLGFPAYDPSELGVIELGE